MEGRFTSEMGAHPNREKAESVYDAELVSTLEDLHMHLDQSKASGLQLDAQEKSVEAYDKLIKELL